MFLCCSCSSYFFAYDITMPSFEIPFPFVVYRKLVTSFSLMPFLGSTFLKTLGQVVLKSGSDYSRRMV